MRERERERRLDQTVERKANSEVREAMKEGREAADEVNLIEEICAGRGEISEIGWRREYCGHWAALRAEQSDSPTGPP